MIGPTFEAAGLHRTVTGMMLAAIGTGLPVVTMRFAAIGMRRR